MASRETDEEESEPISDPASLATLPGAIELQKVVAHARKRAPPQPTSIRQEAVAGLTVTIVSVPDGMAGGVLAGVNPVYGLYASMIGPVVGGLLSSTQLMVINNTSAVSLVVGQALSGVSGEQRESNLFLTVVLAGLFTIAFGLLGLGRMIRFVSYSVMTGFVAGIAGLLVLSQLSTAAGYKGEGVNRIMETVDLMRHFEDINVAAVTIAAATLLSTVVLQRTRLRAFAGLFGIATASLAVFVFGLDVQVVRDVGHIPSGIPIPNLPAFGDTLQVITGALSVATIVVVQGAGVSQSVPNPDGSRNRASRDFIAQGAANVAAGLFRGLPVGGSLSATALNVATGGRRRWAAVFSGLWMAAIVIGVPDLVAQVAMPALAGLLILVGLQLIKPRDVASVWRAGWPSRLVGSATFIATLVLPIQAAIGLGVAISTMVYISRSSADITIVELFERPDGRLEERKPPRRLSGNRVTVLDIYGNLLFAGARTLERLLPPPAEDAEHPVAVLRLRGRTKLGATLEEVLSKYAEKLEAAGGRLYLTGLGKEAHEEAVQMRKLQVSGPVRAYEVTPIIGKSTGDAQADAEAWLIRAGKEEEEEEE